MKLLPQGIEITEVDFASPNKAFFIQKHLKEGDDKAPDHPEQIIWKAYQGNIGISCKIQCNFSFLLMYFFFCQPWTQAHNLSQPLPSTF